MVNRLKTKAVHKSPAQACRQAPFRAPPQAVAGCCGTSRGAAPCRFPPDSSGKAVRVCRTVCIVSILSLIHI